MNLHNTIWTELNRAAMRDRLINEYQYMSPAERQRYVRVAVGRSCRCNDCDCCREAARCTARTRT